MKQIGFSYEDQLELMRCAREEVKLDERHDDVHATT